MSPMHEILKAGVTCTETELMPYEDRNSFGWLLSFGRHVKTINMKLFRLLQAKIVALLILKKLMDFHCRNRR